MIYNELLNKYIMRVKEVYRECPCHISNTNIKECLDINNMYGSDADCIKNEIRICLNDEDKEWAVFHELEHIRTAKNIYGSMVCGVMEECELDVGGFLGTALNEAITDFSVRKLLKRDTNKISYAETKLFVKKICVMLNISENDLINAYNTKNPTIIQSYFKKLNLNIKEYYDLLANLDLFHKYHIDDIINSVKNQNTNYVKKLKIINSTETIKYRRFLKLKINNILKSALKNKLISDSEFILRLNLINQLNI